MINLMGTTIEDRLWAKNLSFSRSQRGGVRGGNYTTKNHEPIGSATRMGAGQGGTRGAPPLTLINNFLSTLFISKFLSKFHNCNFYLKYLSSNFLSTFFNSKCLSKFLINNFLTIILLSVI